MAKKKTNGNMFGSEQLAAKYNLIVSYAKKLCKGSLTHRATDVANNAWLKAYQNLLNFSGTEKQFESWLKRIVYNCFIDETRNNRLVLTKEGNLSAYAQELPDDTENSAVLDEHEKKLLWDAFEKLTKQEINLIYCRTIWGLTLKETEEETGIKWEHISLYNNRALKNLRNLFESRTS
jgi:RNA polymerase sigma factor (sigma-70 family)